METKTINVKRDGGPISIRMDASKNPQSIAANVWRYTADKKKDGKAGIFNSNTHEVPLGIPASIDQKFLLVRSVVIAQNDNPPTHYEVILSVLQDGVELTREIPTNGSGQIGSDNIVFDYRFQIVAL